jgi:hypothetical protein
MKLNNVTLTTKTDSGKLYQLGDVIEFTTESTRMGRTENEKRIQKRIRKISDNYIHVRKAPSADIPDKFNDDEILSLNRTEPAIVRRADLTKYIRRFRESNHDQLPKEINGWTLIGTKEMSEDDSRETPDHILKEAAWENENGIVFHLDWRQKYKCWRIRTPDGVSLGQSRRKTASLSEVDIPENIITLGTALELVVQGMVKSDPENYQEEYTLNGRKGLHHSAARTLLGSFESPELPRTRYTIPETVGDWEQIENHPQWLVWRNTNNSSKWHQFKLRLSSTGSIVVTDNNSDVYERRMVERQAPDGTPHPDNIEKSYQKRRQDMLDDNWKEAIGFMVQTSKRNGYPSIVKNSALDLEALENMSLDLSTTQTLENGTVPLTEF